MGILTRRLALGAAIAVSFGAASQANAESCGGNLIEYAPVTVDGKKIAQLQLYYNPQNGMNCAVMMHGGPTWGVLKDTGVILAKAPRRNAPFKQAAYQRAQFSYMAGPIRTNGRGQCVYAGSGIDYKGKRRSVYTGIYCR